MKKLREVLYIVPIIFAAYLLVACSDEHQANNEHMKQNSSILNSQMQALEKAKGVEQLVNDHAEEQRQEIDQASQ
ncbi:hypothetical protein [sulfur-oxidizing endosymbiont of Gigantopelta aegis]|uniref:hypothetical protein n=1 Tax=sulfur-oxidizing endosymbiont of Gigantopelta aegis TaxID=2794934 RepID=UPI0018DBAA7F|nr:hypothetical protein [sulfur-oxidizing endosymbiont of Gigantopelta aegis]